MKSVRVGEVRYRIVCAAGHGHSFTAAHFWEMKDRAAAEEAKERHDRRRNSPGCAPWTVEARAVSEWGDPDAAEMCLYAIGRTIQGRLL